MKNVVQKVLLLTAGLAAVGLLVFQEGKNKNASLADLQQIGRPQVRSSFSPQNRDDAYARHAFEMRRLRDPETGRIPEDMRSRELDFARRLPVRESLQKNGAAKIFAADWIRRGPVNVGGRTRALAIDLNYNGTSNRRILAGGVSGGMFLSTDDGATWQMTTTLAQFPSATCLVQDPNNRNTWYYGTGELLGSTRAGTLNISGQGIFKSTDNGVTWAQLPATKHASATQFDGPFDFVWNLAMRPPSNAIFAATLGAILRSTDGGNNWTFVLVGQDANNNLSVFSDVAVAANGDVYAALSRNGIGLNNQQFGVFRSTNNGDQFTVISPPGLVADPNRMVLAAAPSDPNTLYLLVQANPAGAVAPDHQFFRYNAATSTWTNLSASLPNEPGLDGNASFSSQGGYDLLVKVKPDNPNVVWIGGTNLYRSTNAGQTFTRVGGYLAADTYGQFANHHSDQHALAFFPNNANAMISGNDGGLAKTTNALAQPQTWTSLNNGYVATQFYAVALDPQTGSNFITGGTQDNGTWGTDVVNFNTPWASLLSGDGAYTDIVAGGNTFYVSAQKGVVIRARRSNNQLLMSLVQPVTPNGDKDFLFIAPFQLDLNNPRVMYLAVGNSVWRNSNLDDITVVDNQDPVTTNWSTLNNSAVANMQVTTLAISKTPANRLYFGATDYQANTAIVRVDNALGNPAGTNITPPGIPGGAYPSCLGVNPNNADEIIAVFSNYRLASLWYSNTGGGSWTNIEGNLAGDEGPSIRWATIVPNNTGRTYLLATSTGIYSTTTLNGANTAWVQEGATPIGNVVVDMIVARPSDGVVVAGTHGRGVYSSQLAGIAGAANLNVTATELNIALRPGTARSVQFNLGNTGTAALDYQITATGPTTNGVIDARMNWENDFSAPVPKFNFAAIAAASGPASSAGESSPPTSTLTLGNFADDALVYDDGNNTADEFIGLGPNSGNDFYWLNTFTPSGFDFRLEAFDFYMRTETAGTNPVYVGVLDASGNTLAQGNLTLATAPNGSFYNITVNPNLTFNDGQGFAIVLGASRVIPFPAGTDVDAAVRNQSFYLNPSTNQYVNLNTISGFENGAFIIRARGTKTGLPNQPPIARGTISKTQATVNETLTFDASQSSDPDGQITQYRWEFGDGSSSNQSVTTHAYSQPGTYTVKLTVTDNQGATGDAQGQVTITGAPNQSPIARATLSKTQARVNESISFDASTSSDPDGQITQYLWNFGDGTTSTQSTTSHAYAQAGNFTYALTVTDNGGATGQTSGQVTITATPTRLTVNPASGTVAPNGSQVITVNFDAQGLAEGNYQGQLSITSNGGNYNLPVRITVSNSVKVDEPRHAVPRAFVLEQNYPNPFWSEATSRPAGNPETKIHYSLPSAGEVYLRVYNLHGELVATLVAGARTAGEHIVNWDGRNHRGEPVASGIYLYRLEAFAANGGITSLTKKMAVMK